MNKAYLEKLKEMLKNDNMSTIAGMNLSDNYIQVWSKSEGTEEDCPVLSVEQILSNKKNASEVADILINNYIQATYAFHHFGLDEYIPVMPIGINLLYRFNEQTIKENGDINIQDGCRTLGDVVGVEANYDLNLEDMIIPEHKVGVNDVEFETFTKLSALYSKLRTSSNIGNLFVSFDELLTELASRGFYCNYDNFKDMEQEEAAILRISTEPFVKKSTNVK